MAMQNRRQSAKYMINISYHFGGQQPKISQVCNVVNNIRRNNDKKHSPLVVRLCRKFDCYVFTAMTHHIDLH